MCINVINSLSAQKTSRVGNALGLGGGVITVVSTLNFPAQRFMKALTPLDIGDAIEGATMERMSLSQNFNKLSLLCMLCHWSCCSC
jgi:hypothetical protein